MHGAYCHEEKYDKIDSVRTECSDGHVLRAESSGGSDAEGMVDGIEERHSRSP